jgi:hypothetical protein
MKYTALEHRRRRRKRAGQLRLACLATMHCLGLLHQLQSDFVADLCMQWVTEPDK